MDDSLPEALRLVTGYLQAGSKQQAMPVLSVYIRNNPSDERAWLLLSQALDDPRQKVECLQRVLKINPANAAALEGLGRSTPGLPVRAPQPTPSQPVPLETASPQFGQPDTVQPESGRLRASLPQSAYPQPARLQPAVYQPLPAAPPLRAAGPEKSTLQKAQAALPKKSFFLRFWYLWVAAAALLFLLCTGVAWLGITYWQLSAPQTASSIELLPTPALPVSTLEPVVAILPPTWTPTPFPTQTPTRTPTLTPVPTQTLEPTAARKTERARGVVAARVGAYPPDFSLLDARSGKKISLASLDGQPVMINFWTTWCGYCKSEMKDLQAVYGQYQKDGFVLLGVNVAESGSTARLYASNLGLTFNILLDSDTHVQTLYHLTGYPTSFFIGRSGKITAVYSGAMDKSQIEFEVGRIMK